MKATDAVDAGADADADAGAGAGAGVDVGTPRSQEDVSIIRGGEYYSRSGTKGAAESKYRDQDQD